MKNFTCTCIAIVFIVQIQAQTLGFEIINNDKRAIIPFELYHNLIVIPVILNNQIPLKFILDTGVRTTILTEKAYSDILNLTYARKYSISGLGGERLIDAYVTNNVALTLPGVQGRGHAMLVLEEDYLELRNYLGADVHGILGYEIFSRFIVEINYDRRELTLTRPKWFKPKRSYEEIPIVIQDTKPYIEGHIVYKNGHHMEVKLLVDTGASHGLQLEANSDSSIFVPDKHLYASLGRGLGGPIEGKVARIKSFHLGDLCWKDPIVTFPDSNSFMDSLKNAGIFRNGSIGGEILSRFIVIFNFPGEKIYLKRSKKFKEPFSYNISGLVVKAIGSVLNTFEIVDVRKNSIGQKAGLKKGDIITAINNIDAKRLHLNQIIHFLSRENKKVKIVVARDGKSISTTFRLKSQI